MHGVPNDLDLKPFEGAILDYVTLARHMMFLSFESAVGTKTVASLQVEGPWELLGPNGEMLDQGHPGIQALNERGPLRIHAGVGRRVRGYTVNPPESFSLHFEGGLSVRVTDHPGYEAFLVEPGGVRV